MFPHEAYIFIYIYIYIKDIINIYIYAFSNAFIQSDLFRLYICWLLELNPTFPLLTQCSTTEPQEHKKKKNVKH